jgi:hypothetical protein
MAPATPFVNAILAPESAHASWFDLHLRGPQALPFVLVFLLAIVVALTVIHFLLYSPKAEAFFQSKGETGRGAGVFTKNEG